MKHTGCLHFITFLFYVILFYIIFLVSATSSKDGKKLLDKEYKDYLSV